MKGIAGYREAKAVKPGSGSERLPAGGYVIKILDVKEENYDWGDVVVLRFDIAEGEYKGFFNNQYKEASDEYKKWKGTYRLNIPSLKSNTEEDKKKFNRSLGFFKSQIEAINTSNNINIDCSGEWDTAVLKNRLVGAVFGNKEWAMDGRKGWYTDCRFLTAADEIRSGNFKIPKDLPLKKEQKTTINDYDTSEFEEVEANAPVPF